MQQRLNDEVGPRLSGQAEAEKDDAVVAAAHSPAQILDRGTRHAAKSVAFERLSAKECAERPDQFEVLMTIDAEHEVSRRAGRGVVRVDDDQCAVSPASGHEPAGTVGRVAFQVTRVSGERIAAPEDHQVAAILDFAQRAGRLADLLHGKDRRAVAAGGGGVDRCADRLGQFHGGPLPGRAAPREAEDQRIPGGSQQLRRLGDGRLERDGVPVDAGDGRLLRVLAEQPGLGHRAGPFGADDPIADYRQSQIIA